MPFKLKLKKTRQYNVVSKNLLVISIELLDGTNVECTLSSESLGKECFEHVCQRAMINQTQFFGLRYITKQNYPKWVDMDMPLRKQLEKYASTTTLYLRVMYYVTSGVSLITDEMTRYHYFLHLKNDVADGKIACNFQQAVLLASYSKQAEYGNHLETNTEHLKPLLACPKYIVENNLLEALTEAVMKHSSVLQNMSQSLAEEYYIATCQELDGYGLENFIAFEENNKEVVLGISVLGISVSNDITQTTNKWYRWSDISNVINNKRTFTIECSEDEKMVNFNFSNAEYAKYVWKLCVLQHTFYMKYEQNGQFKSPDDIGRNIFINTVEDSTNSETTDSALSKHLGSSVSLNANTQSTSCLDLSVVPESNRIRDLLPQYQLPSNSTLSELVYGSQPDINLHNPDLQTSVIKTNVLSPTEPYFNSSQRYPDVTHNTGQYENQLAQNASQKNLYEAQNTSQRNLYENQFEAAHACAVGMKKVSWRNELDEKAYPHSAVNYGSDTIHQMDNLMHGSAVNFLHFYKPPQTLPPPYPTNRPPYLMNKPPYLTNSTPDLASQRANAPLHFVNHVSGSSPDLVSSRSMLNHHLYLSSLSNRNYLTNAHVAYENLNRFSKQFEIENRFPNKNSSITEHIQKIYDDRGNVIYCMPRDIEEIVENQIKNVKISSSNIYNGVRVEGEPIYENVPMRNEMRQRAHSIQSIRFNDKNQLVINEELINSQQLTGKIPTAVRLSSNSVNKDLNINNMQHNLNPLGNVSDSNLYDHLAMELNQQRSPVPSNPTNDLHQFNLDLVKQQQLNYKTSNNISDLNLHDRINLEVNKQQLHLSAQNLYECNKKLSSLKPDDHNSNFKTNRRDSANLKIINREDDLSNIKSNEELNLKINDKLSTLNTNGTRLNKIQSLMELPVMQKDNIKVVKAESFNDKENSLMSTPLDKNKSSFLLSRSISHIESKSMNSSKSQLFEDENTSSENIKTDQSTGKKKKLRWVLLGGRGKSSEKIKSATLGRERKDGSKPLFSKDTLSSREFSSKTANNSKDENSKQRWSTGLPPTISKEALCQLLEIKLADTKLAFEFEQILNEVSTSSKTVSRTGSVSRSDRNSRLGAENFLRRDSASRNYIEYFPYEENRVRITPSKDNKTGFVNASHITASVGAKQVFYICAESPSEQTIGYFLQSIWEADVYLVVELPNSIENFNYLPVNSERCQEYGQYQVWKEYSQDNGQCVTSKLRLYQLNSRSYRSVWHLQYAKWSHDGLPQDVGHFLGFLEELCSVRQQSILEVPIGHNRNPPVMVHCPSGGLRCGLTMASHLLLHTVDHNQELDIPRVIGLLRQQRANLLPTLEQYKFLYKVIIHYLQQTRLI